MSYEEKFCGFLQALEKAKAGKADTIMVPSPETLGDNYDELVESLNRIASAKLALEIVPPGTRKAIGSRN